MKNLKIVLSLIFLYVFLTEINFAEIYSTVSGKVIDVETSKGIKDVKIVLSIYGTGRRDVKSTDAKGEFIFTEIISGKGEISFYPSNTYAWVRSWEKPDSIIVKKGKNLFILKKLKKGGNVEVKVIDKKTNSPIEGVELFIPQEHPGLRTELSDIYSNSQGILIKDRLFPGKYDLNFWRMGYWFKEVQGIEVKSNEVTKVELFYDDDNPINIQGRICCKQDGLPLKNVLISISLKDSEKYWAHTFTDLNGCFSMLDLVPGLYTVTLLGIMKISDDKIENIKIEKDILFNEKDNTHIVNFNVDCTLDYEKWEK